MKELLRQRAWELGFDACRVDRAGRADHAEQFRRWLAAGRHGGMAYLERTADRRVDPREVLGGARSVISLAVSYHDAGMSRVPGASGPGVGESGAVGVVARYACYQDYHDVLAPRLAALAEWLDANGGEGARSVGYVDAGPVLERDVAQRAGVGFIGKHTNVISRRLGNWHFLAEVLTTVELEPDPPEPNRCGSCVRCLEACPTRAITAPFELDARRCISYLTIELKGSIPEDLRARIGTRVFGCDDCLAVCPWNRFAREARMLSGVRRRDLAGPGLVDLLGVDDAEFKRRFGGTPLMRAKRRGLLRNVAVALGNLGERTALPALERAIGDREPLIAEHARWAIAQIESRRRSTGVAGVTESSDA